MSDDAVNNRGVSRRYIIEQAEASLRPLKTDCLDLYQIHRPHPEVAIDETLRALDDLVRAGKVRYIGSTTFAGWQVIPWSPIGGGLLSGKYQRGQPIPDDAGIHPSTGLRWVDGWADARAAAVPPVALWTKSSMSSNRSLPSLQGRACRFPSCACVGFSRHLRRNRTTALRTASGFQLAKVFAFPPVKQAGGDPQLLRHLRGIQPVND